MSQGAIVEKVAKLKERHSYKYEHPEAVCPISYTPRLADSNLVYLNRPSVSAHTVVLSSQTLSAASGSREGIQTP